MGCCKCESQAQVCQGGETERHKHRNLTEEKDLLKRLNRIEGQVRGVKAMVEDERYCVDILNQVSAVQAALNSFSKVLLSNHIKTCVFCLFSTFISSLLSPLPHRMILRCIMHLKQI